VGDDFHFVSRVGQKLVVFRASFSGAGFKSSGAVGDEVFGHGFEQTADDLGLFAGLLGAGLDGLGRVPPPRRPRRSRQLAGRREPLP